MESRGDPEGAPATGPATRHMIECQRRERHKC